MKIPNRVQLITYPDSLGKNLKELNFVLDTYLKDEIGGVHILPYYPSSGDRGFAPLTHKKIAPEFGKWGDIQKIASKYTLMSDLVLNHISAKSKYFSNYLKHGSYSKYADWFITSEKFTKHNWLQNIFHPPVGKILQKMIYKFRQWDKLFHINGVWKLDAKKLYRPRMESPFVPFVFADRKIRRIWCSFTNEQVDLDVNNPEVKKLLQDFIIHLSKNGTKLLRLDGAGYVIKKRGTSSFMIPETYQFISWIGEIAHEHGVATLVEVHNHYEYQINLAKTKNVDYVYDFQIPLLTLHAIYNQDTRKLKEWIKIRPNKTLVVLDCHDGLPVVDLQDLLAHEELEKLKQDILKRGGNEALRASGTNAENVDTYQINCTYYSALDEDDNAYIVARAIQLFLPGIPQIYYDGLLAGKNDIKKLERTNVGRDILRRDYDLKMVDEAFKKDVVQRLLKLMKLRNNHPAFDGKFSLLGSSDRLLVMRWDNDKHYCQANIYLENLQVEVFDSGREEAEVV